MSQLAWKILALSVVSAVAGCGGGGGTSGVTTSSSSPNTGTSTSVPVATSTPTTTSTAPASKAWVQIGSFSSPYIGTFLATNSFVNADGSNSYIFGGPSYSSTSTCPNVPYMAVKIDISGNITNSTALLNQGSTAAIHPRKLVVADFNGDGISDLFFANHGCDQPPFPGEKNNYFISSGSAYADMSTSLPQLNNFTHSAAAGDVRKIGKTDVLVGVLGMQDNPGLQPQYQGDNTSGTYVGAYMLRNDGAGNFTYDNTSLPLGLANPDSPPAGAATTRFTSSEFVDLNGDGYPDLVVGADQNANVAGSVFMNDKNGKFKTTEIPLPVGLFGAGNTITVAITIADVNNDGLPDLLLSQTPNAPNFYGGGKIQVVVNKGNGVFEDQTSKIIPNQQTNAAWTQWIHYVDINGDGVKDILLEMDQPGSSDVLAYIAQADGTFAPMARSSMPASVTSLHPLQFGNRNVLVSASPSQGTAVLKIFEYK